MKRTITVQASFVVDVRKEAHDAQITDEVHLALNKAAAHFDSSPVRDSEGAVTCGFNISLEGRDENWKYLKPEEASRSHKSSGTSLDQKPLD